MLTAEQKEKNKQYVLSHLEEYSLDNHGNIVMFSPEADIDEWFFLFGEKSLTREGYREIKKNLISMILREKEEWEIVMTEYNTDINCFQHRKTKRKINKRALSDWYDAYVLTGELGYRESVWKDYDKKRNQEGWVKEKLNYYLNNFSNSTNQENQSQGQPNQNPTPKQPPQEPKSQTQTPQSTSNPTPTQENTNDNSTKPTKSEPTNSNPNQNKNKSDQPTNNPTNSPLPPPTYIQSHYNSDPVKSELTTNPNLTNNQDQQSAQELLKLIITAELLTEKGQFNQEILTKLLTIKKENTKIYNELNKEKRLDKSVNALESIQKAQKNNNPTTSSKNKNTIPTGIIVGGGILLLGLGIIISLKKKMLKKKTNKKN